MNLGEKEVNVAQVEEAGCAADRSLREPALFWCSKQFGWWVHRSMGEQ